MFAAAAAASSSLATWQRQQQRRFLPQRRPHSSGGGGGGGAPSPHTQTRRAAAAGGAAWALLPPPPQEHPAKGDRGEALALSSVLLLVLPPLPPPPGITRAPRSPAAALVAMMMMSRTQPLGEGRRGCVCVSVWGEGRAKSSWGRGHGGKGRERGGHPSGTPTRGAEKVFSPPAPGHAARAEAAGEPGPRWARGVDDSAGGHGHLGRDWPEPRRSRSPRRPPFHILQRRRGQPRKRPFTRDPHVLCDESDEGPTARCTTTSLQSMFPVDEEGSTVCPVLS
ncbi:collagen alpha-1(III) chain isoform X3 [Bos taurus]|uniref:collagen alpha-1(III) chain isoform X3 n=1 Tax=Bos taurus TaxID=9913 RepID=UPI0028CB4B92|nr:collagen alpha-1(III) chain isoform X3 [Bos taurus]